MNKRPRACEECQRLKIKCDASGPTGACERCRRHNVDCVPAAPRLQRDRIAALEEEVQQLRNQLRQQSEVRAAAFATPERTPDRLSGTPGSEGYGHNLLSFLDARIPQGRQRELLLHYAQHAGTMWPVVRLPDDLDELRARSPVLLMSVLVYTVTRETQGTEIEVHRDLMREAMHVFGDEILGRGNFSLELVQAILVASFWFKTTGWGEQGSCYQLIQLATDMAIDLGIAGPSLMPSPIAYMAKIDNAASVEARRTWLACFLATAKSSISTRRPTPVPWNGFLEECVVHLERRGDRSDLLLAQIVRITRLIQDIADELRLCQMAIFVDGNDFATHETVETLKSRVEAWAAQIPHTLEPTLRQTVVVWRHFAMVYAHEVVLHTPTNKMSFAAPFIPGRIPVKDLPAPANMIPPLRSALQGLVWHCHAVVDAVTDMDPAVILSLPFFCFAPTVVYCLYVLVTALVAATSPNNTYGQVLSRHAFGVEQCNRKLRSVTDRLKALDPTFSCFTTRLFDATSWLETWYDDYVGILEQYESKMDET